jgi:hypothetical protein
LSNTLHHSQDSNHTEKTSNNEKVSGQGKDDKEGSVIQVLNQPAILTLHRPTTAEKQVLPLLPDTARPSPPLQSRPPILMTKTFLRFNLKGKIQTMIEKRKFTTELIIKRRTHSTMINISKKTPLARQATCKYKCPP